MICHPVDAKQLPGVIEEMCAYDYPEEKQHYEAQINQSIIQSTIENALCNITP
jgi:hypothetical protein